jgi:hypothetical protein
MKKTIKIITTFLMGLTICLSLNAMSNRSHMQKIVTMNNQISQDYLENTTINTDCLQNVGVQNKSCKPGNDRNHEIKFENKFKKVYLSPDYHDIDIKNILSECKQTTPVTKGQNYGIFDNVQDKTGTINNDIKNRVQD